jgi:hypothetical protein
VDDFISTHCSYKSSGIDPMFELGYGSGWYFAPTRWRRVRVPDTGCEVHEKLPVRYFSLNSAQLRRNLLLVRSRSRSTVTASQLVKRAKLRRKSERVNGMTEPMNCSRNFASVDIHCSTQSQIKITLIAIQNWQPDNVQCFLLLSKHCSRSLDP